MKKFSDDGGDIDEENDLKPEIRLSNFGGAESNRESTNIPT